MAEKQVSINGYRWFDDVNTYHTVIIFVGNVEIFRSRKMEYGYEGHYQLTGFREFLKATGRADEDVHRVRDWFEDAGIAYTTDVTDVPTEADLFTFIPFGDQSKG